jgi:hypothetical protein
MMPAERGGIMRILTLGLAAAMSLIVLAACMPAPEPTDTTKPSTQRYVSAKQVSTDCTSDFIGDPPPGFAPRPGGVFEEMPEMLAMRVGKGAERPPVETDKGRVAPGYVLIEPGFRQQRFLIDSDGEVVATFENELLGFTQFLPDGSRLTNSNTYSVTFKDGGGMRGCLEEFGPDGSLNWRLGLSTDDYVQHHDVVKLPNGNVLTLVWENITADQAIELGRDPEFVAENGNFWFDGIIEINPMTTEIVWEWSARDHLIQDFDPGKPNYGVVADNPGRLDINVFRKNREGGVSDDWTHANALDFNAELDQIIFSSNYLSEVYVIDHSTTPFEAQGGTGGRYGKGGDFLFRWGNPANYDRGDADDQQLFAQHDSHWIRPGLPGEGNIMIFNNGLAEPRPYTTVVEIAPPMNDDGSYVLGDDGSYEAAEVVWEYSPTGDEQFFSFFISGANRLPNGNTLVTKGAGGHVREITADGEIVWEYIFDEGDGIPHMLFRAYKYPEDHPAVQAILNLDAQ